MGRQINFYLHQDDQEDFDKLLKSFGEIVLFYSIHYSDNVLTVPDTLIRDKRKERSRVYLMRKQDFKMIPLTQVEKFGYWLVHDNELPVVHFDRCVMDDTKIERGRIYFQPQFLSEMQWVRKSEDFIKWGDSIISKVRRKLEICHCQVGPHHYKEYLGAHALKWMNDHQAKFGPGPALIKNFMSQQ